MSGRTLWWLPLLLTAGLAQGAVRASLDSTVVGPGDSVQLTLQIDRQTGDTPDLAPLAQLEELAKLDISETHVVDVAPLAKLPALTELHVANVGTLTDPA